MLSMVGTRYKTFREFAYVIGGSFFYVVTVGGILF